MKVLLPIDRNESRARSAAETVATIPEAEKNVQVTVLHVAENKEYLDDGIVRPEDLHDDEDLPSSVTVAADTLQEHNISFEILKEQADPQTRIIELANEMDADRIIMSGRKQTPIGKVMFGSVTQSVLLNASTPVTVITE